MSGSRVQIGGGWLDLIEHNETTTEAPGLAVSIVSGGYVVGAVNYEGQISLPVVVTYQPTFTVTLSVDGAEGTAGYMLVDLDGTAAWPHTNTDHVVLKAVFVDTNTSSAFVGDLLFGFLSNVDDTNGDFNQIGVLHGMRSADVGKGAFDFSVYGMGLETDEWFGPTNANDTTWQTDVGLTGPDGGTTYVSGNGDFVAKLVSSAGTVDLSFTVIYTTSP